MAKTDDGTCSVRFETSQGEFCAELWPGRAPLTVANFLQYVEERFFDGTLFHRIVPGFVIQGGGLTGDFRPRPTRPPVRNESANGLRNERGTLSMARTQQADSATSQFFVNLADNAFLDHRPGQDGYAVFGRVTSGMDVIDRIGALPTGRRHGYTDTPLDDVVILTVRQLPGEQK